jgi:quercetin dioxygenase-like cupin family protein
MRCQTCRWCSRLTRRIHLAKRSILNSISIAMLGVLYFLNPESVTGQEKSGINHTPLLKSELSNSHGQEVIVWDTEYAPGEVNPRHLHPAAITFHVLSGTGIWQEDGKPPITLHAGDSLFVAAGTIHSHWNPNATERLRFLEFIVAAKGKGHSIPQPLKN